MQSSFTFYNAPDHAWLMVTDADLALVGLKRSQFSGNGAWVQRRTSGQVFLEEDCDAPQFLKAWESKFGKPQIIERYIDDRSEMGIR
jgi:hypothetical protein